ncbi:hypothetical protein [Methanoregula sp. UBA64]|nr:hypothetical protein [Methanoregula sp. UBA64]
MTQSRWESNITGKKVEAVHGLMKGAAMWEKPGKENGPEGI